jgi:predicted nucleic acid-binding protein
VYTLDTNTIIYYLKGEELVINLLGQIFSDASPVYISTVTELELFSSPALSADDAETIHKLVSSIVTIPLDSQIARIAAAVRRKYGLKTPDSAIAATSLLTGTTLVTRNAKDFRKVENLQLREI